MFSQWTVFKLYPGFISKDYKGIAIWVREDFQEDLEVLLLEETVGTHRGQSKIHMTLFPVVAEILDCEDQSLSMHALIFDGNRLEKSFDTV